MADAKSKPKVKNDTQGKQPANQLTKKSKKDYGIIDMMLSKPSERVVDSETLITETQNRVWRALKSGYEY